MLVLMITGKVGRLPLRASPLLAGALMALLAGVAQSSAIEPESALPAEAQREAAPDPAAITLPAAPPTEPPNVQIPALVRISPETGTIIMQVAPDGTASIMGTDPGTVDSNVYTAGGTTDVTAHKGIPVPTSAEPPQEGTAPPSVMSQAAPDAPEKAAGSEPPAGEQPAAAAVPQDASAPQQTGQAPESDAPKPEGELTPEEALIRMQGEPDGMGR